MALPQYITGPVEPKKVKVATATAYAKGDLMAKETTDAAVPIASLGAATGTLAQIQNGVAAAFLGVALDEKTSSQVRPFGSSEDSLTMVATGPAIYEYDCASATFALGAYIGCDTATGPIAHNSKVIGVASDSLAIGLAAESYPSATTRVKVLIRSAVLPLSK